MWTLLFTCVDNIAINISHRRKVFPFLCIMGWAGPLFGLLHASSLCHLSDQAMVTPRSYYVLHACQLPEGALYHQDLQNNRYGTEKV